MPAERSPHWRQLLAEVTASPRLGAGVAELLAHAGTFAVPLEPEEEASDSFEPYLSLLRLYAALDRALSEVLYRRAYNEEPPLLGSDFGDWAAGSLAREAALDLHLAGAAFGAGLDLQAMVLLRQMAELSWRGLMVAADPEVADDWWQALVTSAATGERARIEKRLWSRHFRPARQIESVARIEARVEGLSGEPAEAHARETIAVLSHIYALLSGSSHGGADLVYASVTRGTGRLPEDPFARIGEPTELGKRIVRASLYLQWRFWRYFPRAAFPHGMDAVLPNTADATLLTAAPAVNELVLDQYWQELEVPSAEAEE